MLSITVIVVTGMDGSGKTTIVNRLLRRIKANRVWIKSLHTLAYLIYVFFTKIWGREYIVNPRGKVVEHYATRWMRKMGTTWLLIEFISILPWILLKVEIPSRWRTIICDRYVPDFLATTALRIGDPLTPWKTIIGRFLQTRIRKTKTILLNIEIKTMLKRRPYIEYVEDEIRLLKAIYKTIAENTDTCIVDTDKYTIDETEKIVLEKLGLK